VENNLAVLQMVKHRSTILLPCIYSREMKTYVHTKHAHMFIAALFTTAPQKVEELPYDPPIPLLHIYPRELKAYTQNLVHECSW